MVGGIWEVVLEAQLEADAEPGVQLGTCTPNCRGEEERVMPNVQPLLKPYPISDDALCLHCTSLPHSSPPKKKTSQTKVCEQNWLCLWGVLG